MSTNQKYHKKTILQVVPALVSGGVERGTIEIAKKLVDSGYNSIVISAGGALVKSLENSGSEHITLNVATKNPLLIWWNSRKIAKIIKEKKVDIIHARSRAPAWSCFMAAKSTKIKLVTTFHGIYNFDSGIKKFYNSIMAEGNVVIAVSEFVKNHIIKNYNIEKERVSIIHRGVDHNYFDKKNITEKTKQKYQDKYNVPKDTTVILLPARMTEWKGQIYLTKALKKIKELNFYCIMAGDLSKHPQYVSRLKDLINEYKMQNKIQLFGNEPNIENLYAISDIVISASTEPEAFGRTIIEAQSMETFVLATNIGGACETIEDGKTGFHTVPDNVDKFANKIEDVLCLIGSEEQEKVTKAARASAIKNFSLDLMLEKILKIYQKIIADDQ